jgi:hypothetical protein
MGSQLTKLTQERPKETNQDTQGEPIENDIFCCININDPPLSTKSRKDCIANYIVEKIKNVGHCNKFLAACLKAHENVEFQSFFPNQKFEFFVQIKPIRKGRLQVTLVSNTLWSVKTADFLNTDFAKHLNELAKWSGHYFDSKTGIKRDDYKYSFERSDCARVYSCTPEEAVKFLFDPNYLTFCIDNKNKITNLQPTVYEL